MNANKKNSGRAPPVDFPINFLRFQIYIRHVILIALLNPVPHQAFNPLLLRQIY